VLGLEQLYDLTSDDGSSATSASSNRAGGLVLCLVGHAADMGDGFRGFRTGLDHLEFFVPRRQDLSEWADRLNDLGVAPSGVKDLDYTPDEMVTFRDPDHIQLKFSGGRPLSRLRQGSRPGSP
jgi:hypothetical protein